MSENIKISQQDGKDFDVPVEGSIGLLALGHLGLKAWRDKRKSVGYDVVAEKKKMMAELEKQKKESEKKEKEGKDGEETSK